MSAALSTRTVQRTRAAEADSGTTRQPPRRAPPAGTSPRPPGSPRPPSRSSSATNGAAGSPSATAERVRDAARELGYRPNLAARNLRLGRTRTALLVVPALTTEFFARVYTGAARVAADHGFGVVLYPSPEGIGPARDPFASARAALDGVIASSMAADALDRHPRRGLPLVMLDSDPDGGRAPPPSTSTSPTACARSTEHLLGLGHRRFLHLAADVPSWTFDVRARALARGAAARPRHAAAHATGRPRSSTTGRTAAEAALTGPGAPPHGAGLRRRHPRRGRLQGRPPAGPAGPRGRLRHRLRRPGPGHRRRTRS